MGTLINDMEQLPLYVKEVIENSNYDFDYAIMFDTHYSLKTESGFCFQTVERKKYSDYIRMWIFHYFNDGFDFVRHDINMEQYGLHRVLILLGYPMNKFYNVDVALEGMCNLMQFIIDCAKEKDKGLYWQKPFEVLNLKRMDFIEILKAILLEKEIPNIEDRHLYYKLKNKYNL